ncbi:hypothetical protein [Peribacillus alkalitolerans]|uniref:hypothetical protein n=1 Tax=Peribacillus alkalitolerans TaxID=1550385 RepID=UPI0013D4B7F3|nr:hypothetical protein [Peribacillus alkalitolerans]
MSKNFHLFNIVAGIIIIGSMIQVIFSGSNMLPYLVIVLFFLSYWLQKVNFIRFTRFLGVAITVLLLLFSLLPLLDFIFPFAP